MKVMFTIFKEDKIGLKTPIQYAPHGWMFRNS